MSSCKYRALLRSGSPSGKCAKLRTVAASNNRDHTPWSLCYCLFAPHMCIWVLFFAHIPFVVNCTFNATPTERLQQHFHHWCCFSITCHDDDVIHANSVLCSLALKFASFARRQRLQRQQVERQLRPAKVHCRTRYDNKPYDLDLVNSLQQHVPLKQSSSSFSCI